MSIATVSKGYTFTAATVAKSSEVNSDLDVIYAKVNEIIPEHNTLTGYVGQDVKATASPTFVAVTANLTGNVTGNVTGAVTGNCSGTAGNGVPAGTIIHVCMNTPPTGYLKANGASVLRADYAALFTAIGTTFGTVDGTHFTLPDLRGEFVRSWADDGSLDSTRVFGSVQTADNAPHDHTLANALYYTAPGSGLVWANGTGGGYLASEDTSSSGTEGHPHNIALLACIKY